MTDFLEAMRVEVPENDLDGMRVWRFKIPPNDPENLHNALRGRGTLPGWYTGLYRKVPGAGPEGGHMWRVWMSDVDAERRDHLPPLRAALDLRAKRMLVNGLGLGMIVKAALTIPSLERIDVVEIDERVIKLVGPSYADPRVNIIHGDALKQCFRWPRRSRWDVVWHDIWPSGDPRHKPALSTLTHSYGGRSSWQGAWAYDEIMRRA